MAKGYMIFVEGGHEPRLVHDDFKAAEIVARKHAREFPGKEVMLLQISKRFKSLDGKEAFKLETHLPPKPEGSTKKRTLGLKDLVFRDKATAAEGGAV
jgi:hypothetical protein